MAERHYYIRFGGIPRDEKSVAWTSENEIKGEEPGVSVYDALTIILFFILITSLIPLTLKYASRICKRPSNQYAVYANPLPWNLM